MELALGVAARLARSVGGWASQRWWRTRLQQKGINNIRLRQREQCRLAIKHWPGKGSSSWRSNRVNELRRISTIAVWREVTHLTIGTCTCIHDTKTTCCITTDKVYHNNEWLYPYRETDTLGGYDPYSSSKAAAELVIDSYRKSFFTNTNIFIASARAGNVIGGGDWSEDRLIPDIVRAAQKNEDVTLRNPTAVRPWQHVLDPIFGYLLLAKTIDEKGSAYCQAYNFGPRTDEAKTVFEVCAIIMAQLSSGKVIIENQKIAHPHEAGLLTLDISKSLKELGWSP
ncbi:MAG: NAD-dependent epimerase/dehydratase family protein, partial [Proteobacteria bacterium]|nr:NAD-dependent epimerase/dehydratase family protein [Pseudomonadota bacterium]